MKRFIACALFCVSAPLSAETYIIPNDKPVARLDIFQDCDTCPEMVVLPMGRFTMGAPLEESAAVWLYWNKPKPGVKPGSTSEGSVHEVEIDIPIAMGRNEVTRAEWLACVTEGGCSHVPDQRILKFPEGFHIADRPRHPVLDVSYLNIQEYLVWLNRKVGADVYRLPTEAEWEYAARAGTQTKFAQGDTLSPEQANIGVFHQVGNQTVADPNNRKTPVVVDALDAANAWGLRHISGNVIELTMTCTSDRHLGLPTSSLYLSDAKRVSSCRRIKKGGAYHASAEYARPASRRNATEDYRRHHKGFRVVRQIGTFKEQE